MAAGATVTISAYDGPIQVDSILPWKNDRDKRQTVVLRQGTFRVELLCMSVDQIDDIAQNLLIIARELSGDTPDGSDDDDIVDATPVEGTRVKANDYPYKAGHVVITNSGKCVVKADNGDIYPWDDKAWSPVS